VTHIIKNRDYTQMFTLQAAFNWRRYKLRRSSCCINK